MDRPAGIVSRMSGDERGVGMLIHNFLPRKIPVDENPYALAGDRNR